MNRRRWYFAGAMLAVVVALSATGFAVAKPSSPQLTKVTIQLKCVTQSQFAGYYAAKAKVTTRLPASTSTSKSAAPRS